VESYNSQRSQRSPPLERGKSELIIGGRFETCPYKFPLKILLRTAPAIRTGNTHRRENRLAQAQKQLIHFPGGAFSYHLPHLQGFIDGFFIGPAFQGFINMILHTRVTIGGDRSPYGYQFSDLIVEFH
jgi:hypothetical protein